MKIDMQVVAFERWESLSSVDVFLGKVSSNKVEDTRKNKNFTQISQN